MNKLNFKYLSLTISFLLIFTIGSFAATIDDWKDISNWEDEQIPESWYQAPKLASEYEITNFEQSPMLDNKVTEGELPPVEQRLPDDPPAIKPYKEIGEYGGTLVSWGNDLNSIHGSVAGGVGTMMHDGMALMMGRVTPDASEVVPYGIKDWEYSEDYKELTIYLREGMKWSDGHPFTTDDFMYWWEHVANNEDLNPSPPEEWYPPLMDVEKIDDYTLTYHFGIPQPLKYREFATYFPGTYGGFTTPKHHMKQYHIDFSDKEELLEEAEEEGYETWYEYYEYQDTIVYPERNRPTLLPWVITERTSTHLIGERNPYFPFVDVEGNQLPYIDKVRVNRANDREMQTMKAATGETNFAGREAKISDMALFRRNAEKEGYRVLTWYQSLGNYFGIMPNFTHKVPEMREIMQDDRFRKGLSLAIDRDEINDKVYLGEATPMQTTMVPWSKYFKDEYAEAYADYDPERAKQYFDDMGMVDVNDDGYRERPDGEEFKPEFLYMEAWGPNTEILEVVREHWREVGINIEPKLVGGSGGATGLFTRRRSASDWDISFNLINGTTDIGFRRKEPKSFQLRGFEAWPPWPLWSSWFNTNGESGEEPPDQFKQLQEWHDTYTETTDEEVRKEMARKLLEAQADNLWTIGTVGITPKPIVVKNLHNIPPSLPIWSDETQRIDPVYPIQFYMNE